MSKGGYLGGSTVIHGPTPKRSAPRRKGLLALEVELDKTGKVSPQTLAPPISNKKSKKLKVRASEAPKPNATEMPTTRKKALTNGNGKRTGSPKDEPGNSKPPKPAAIPPHSPRYGAAEIGEHLRRHHPNCRKAAQKRVATLASKGSWTGMTPAEVVASCMESYVLYEVCGLQRLVDLGIPRDAALELVTPQVKAVLDLWGAKATWLK